MSSFIHGTLFQAIYDDDEEMAAALIARGDAMLPDNYRAPRAAFEIGRWAIVAQLERTHSLGGFGVPTTAIVQGREDIIARRLRLFDRSMLDSVGPMLLSFAETASMMRVLIGCGIDVNARSEDGNRTALLMAADETSSYNTVQALLDCGADVDAVDSLGQTALNIAVMRQDVRLAQILLRAGARRDVVFDESEELWLALVAGDPAALDSIDHDRFHIVAAAGHTALLRAMLLHARPGDYVDANGDDFVMCAVRAGQADVVRMLLANGAAADGLLHIAAKEGHVATIEPILACLREPELRRAELCDALGVAGSAAMVDALVEAGADPRDGEPLTNAVSWDAVQRLVERGADPNVGCMLGAAAATEEATAAMVAMLLAGADVDRESEDRTPLQCAFLSCNLRHATLLLAAGADPDRVSVADARARFSTLYRQAALLLAAGATTWQLDQIDSMSADEREAALARVPSAKKAIDRAGFASIRARTLEISVALQEMQLPAPQLIEIVVHACEPFARQLPYHMLWDAVVLVKNFRRRG